MKFPVGVNEYHSIYFGYAIWIHCVSGIRSILEAEQKINCSFRNYLRTNSDRLLFPYVTKSALYCLFFCCFFTFGSGIMWELCLYLYSWKPFFKKNLFNNRSRLHRCTLTIHRIWQIHCDLKSIFHLTWYKYNAVPLKQHLPRRNKICLFFLDQNQPSLKRKQW